MLRRIGRKLATTSTMASCVASSDFFPIFSDAMDAKAPCDQALRHPEMALVLYIYNKMDTLN